VETPGVHRGLRGHGRLRDVVLVDQSPIGRTARSNPVSYVGAFDAIRELFAAAPLARARGYTAGTFSFNSGLGRCPTCSGSGFEHVEMQFLADVYLRCPDCDGSRYRPEVLEVTLAAADGTPARSVAGVMELTVAEALAFFANRPAVANVLEPLSAVGLAYLKLGQPVPTLSGGEAQRLKLAGHLAAAKKSGPRSKVSAPRSKVQGPGTLFLFDEPTTGLHFADIATLLKAFRRLLAEGDSLLVIEHNLDVIRAADWLIDLGPEGGEAGGEVVCTGTPAEVMACERSYTGQALREYEAEIPPAPPLPKGGVAEVHEVTPFGKGGRAVRGGISAPDAITIRNARDHNLKHIDLDIPRDRFTVLTGVSGSGKSTVAFDILFAEGQRRYLESLNAYARQFVQPAARPEVDAISGIPPTVAIEQRTSRGGRKSTVATMTELYHFLRLLFLKLGTPFCPDCEVPIEEQTEEAIAARLLRELRDRKVSLLAPLVTARKGLYTDLAKWAAGKGFVHLRVDGQWLPTIPWPRLDRFREHNIELPVGELTVTPEAESELRELLGCALEFGKGVVLVLPLEKRKQEAQPRLFSTRRACPQCSRSFPEPDPRLFSFNSKHGWCPRCFGTGLVLPGFDEQQSGEEIWWNAWWEGEETTCPACHGQRLRPEALAVRFDGLNIAEWTALPVATAAGRLEKLQLRGRSAAIARDILPELSSRLAFLREVGLAYLSLDRAAPTLSGGEAQRLRLAAQLGSNLRGVCYILDEPTIGLHPRDNRMLLDTLRRLEGKGNTIVVVEHDEETIRRAEHVIDLGPGGGVDGGQVVATGTVEELMRNPASVTGRFLAEPLRHPLVERRPTDSATPRLKITGAGLHNLKQLRLALPLGRLVCVTGVSGSGKSSLVRGVLHDNLHRLLSGQRSRKANPPQSPLMRGEATAPSPRMMAKMAVGR
jgi:excinuclease ABC subunit A